MRTARSHLLPVAVVAASLGWAAAAAPAAVSLSITDGSGPPTDGTALPGGSFSFALNLVSTTTATVDQSTGLDYYFRVPAEGTTSTRFRIIDRIVGASSYSDVYRPDSVVEAMAASSLNPANDENLGASLADVNTPNGQGTFLVANYTIGVAAGTPAGTYTFETFSNTGSNPNAGYVGSAARNFAPTPFASHATYTLTVVPEPATAGLAGAAAVAGLAARRRRVTPRSI